ncbi:hypothetical protein BELL_0146g00040 [Botrytis elliptica]|uniref:Uncharacterized protein n=1 Tax=Botrytis elliptica TaxID=278938 RepID=A0A4Z1K5I2_9HELO|nr:hypothetical protein BELL_0146g00040 [Botrytis elliptica]
MSVCNEPKATRAFRDINSLHDLASGDDGDLILQLKIAFRSYPPSIGLVEFNVSLSTHKSCV